jgi:hypothetical protein
MNVKTGRYTAYTCLTQGKWAAACGLWRDASACILAIEAIEVKTFALVRVATAFRRVNKKQTLVEEVTSIRTFHRPNCYGISMIFGSQVCRGNLIFMQIEEFFSIVRTNLWFWRNILGLEANYVSAKQRKSIRCKSRLTLHIYILWLTPVNTHSSCCFYSRCAKYRLNSLLVLSLVDSTIRKPAVLPSSCLKIICWTH